MEWAYEVEIWNRACVSTAYSFKLLGWNGFLDKVTTYTGCIIHLLMKFIIKVQTRQNMGKKVKCGDTIIDVRGNAKLMINFFRLSIIARLSFFCFLIAPIIAGIVIR